MATSPGFVLCFFLGGWETVDLPVAGRFLFVPLLMLRSILERYASQKAKSTQPAGTIRETVRENAYIMAFSDAFLVVSALLLAGAVLASHKEDGLSRLSRCSRF